MRMTGDTTEFDFAHSLPLNINIKVQAIITGIATILNQLSVTDESDQPEVYLRTIER